MHGSYGKHGKYATDPIPPIIPIIPMLPIPPKAMSYTPSMASTDCPENRGLLGSRK